MNHYKKKRAGKGALVFLVHYSLHVAVLHAPDPSVDGVFQAFASLEARNLGRSNLDFLAGLRVTARALGAIFHEESAEAHQSNLIAGLERIGDSLNGGVQRTTSISLGDIGAGCDGINEFGFIHVNPLVIGSINCRKLYQSATDKRDAAK